MMRLIALALAALMIHALDPACSAAQSIWMPRDQDHAVLFEALRPSVERSDQDFLTGTYFLGGRARLSSGLSLVGEIPVSRFNGIFLFGLVDEEVQSSTIGDVYLGVEVRPSDSVLLELGGRPPIVDNDGDGVYAAFIGHYTDMTRFDAFLPHTASLHGLVNFRRVDERGLLTRARLGPLLEIPTEDTEVRDTELFALYMLQVGYEGRALRAGGAIGGTVLMTEDSGNLGARSANQIELHADFGPGEVRPGIDLKLPLGSVANLIPVVVGISVGASF